MKKVVLLLAAAMIVSAPLVATTTTDTFAAAKAKKATKEAAKPDPNQAFGRALGDLFDSLGKPWPTADKGGKGKKAKKA